jgi:hypothetical protein
LTKIIYTSILALTICSIFFFPRCKNGIGSDQDTIDTTSHDFVWTIDTIGDRSTYLHDVFIIDEHNIWIVGEIYKGIPETSYNVAHWNGEEYKLKLLKYDGTKPILPIQGIWAISNNEVWLASGSIFYWNGQNGEISYQRDIGTSDIVTKIWYNTYSDIYGVGRNGIIVHYNGSTWEKLESGTTTDIRDIWGAVNSQSGRKTILCPVSDRSHRGEYRLLTISNSTVRDTLNWDLERRILSVWFNHNSPVYECGSGLRVYKDNSWNEIDIPSYITLRVRGSAWNNIFVVGVFGLVMHYNGSTWHEYPELAFENGELKGLFVTENLVVATGQTGSKGIIITGKRK